MYSRFAEIYDAIYGAQGKDYGVESQKLIALIRRYKHSDGNTLLDIACGTGRHLEQLRGHFHVEGLDNSEAMLRIARGRLPDTPLHLADMADFQLGRAFDVITCLFSAIGYVQTLPRLGQALQAFGRHLRAGGVLILEPWFGPGQLDSGSVHATFVDEPELKVARMNINRNEGNLSYLDFHFLVATPAGVEHYTETHIVGLFSHEQYLQALQAAGLKAIHEPEGLEGRGLYIGLK